MTIKDERKTDSNQFRRISEEEYENSSFNDRDEPEPGLNIRIDITKSLGKKASI